LIRRWSCGPLRATPLNRCSMDEYKKYVKDNREGKLVVIDAFAEW
jgi:hypothetical protein